MRFPCHPGDSKRVGLCSSEAGGWLGPGAACSLASRRWLSDAGPGRDAREQTDTRIGGVLQPPGLKRQAPLQMEASSVSCPLLCIWASEWERKGGWREPREGGQGSCSQVPASFSQTPVKCKGSSSLGEGGRCLPGFSGEGEDGGLPTGEAWPVPGSEHTWNQETWAPCSSLMPESPF